MNHVDKESLHFDVHASVVYQLGETLISDEIQALMELVKNAYDADATYVKVIINTGNNDTQDTHFPDANGYIMIEDDGHGMNYEAIQQGWLTISNSHKREMKRRNQTTSKGRTPLGDKGLGRLGAQRLGANLEIQTLPIGSKEGHHVAFKWEDFQNCSRFDGVPLYVGPANNIIRGTRVIISDLRDMVYWKAAQKNLQRSLSLLISPYEELQNSFRVILIINGAPIDLISIPKRIRNASLVQYSFSYNGNKIEVFGRARLAYYKDMKEWAQFSELLDRDGDENFLKFLTDKPLAKDILLSRANDGWFVTFQRQRTIEDVNLLYCDDELVDPGPFTGEIDLISRSMEGENDIFNSLSEYRNYIEELSGIRVYRDGFGVRVDSDWLGLSEQWSSAKSYYTLRPGNTIGYVSISARDNAVLEETTDREGFKKSPYYSNFRSLLDQVVEFAADAQNFLRRSAIEYLKAHREAAAKVNASTTSNDIAEEIEERVESLGEVGTSLDKLNIRLTEAITNATTKATAYHDGERPNRDELLGIINELKQQISEANDVVRTVRSSISEVNRISNLGRVLSDRIDKLGYQLELVHEMVGLGLTAEALSHEIFIVTDRVSHNIKQVKSYLKDNRIDDRNIFSFVEHVRSSIMSLRKEISYLAPALRYVREKRESFVLSSFINEAVLHHQERLSELNIGFEVTLTNDFSVRMSRGKLIQVIDNLVLNSEYWIREDIKRKALHSGVISIEISAPYLFVSDSGRGVDPSVEESLFEPFVTSKGKNIGRGLGLFIARQFLDADGCAIDLRTERNHYGRRFIFEIDLTGVMEDVKE